MNVLNCDTFLFPQSESFLLTSGDKWEDDCVSYTKSQFEKDWTSPCPEKQSDLFVTSNNFDPIQNESKTFFTPPILLSSLSTSSIMSQEDQYLNDFMLSDSTFDLSSFINEDDNGKILNEPLLEELEKLEMANMELDFDCLTDDSYLFGGNVNEDEKFDIKAQTTSAAGAAGGPGLDCLSQVDIQANMAQLDLNTTCETKSRRKSALGSRNFHGVDMEKEQVPELQLSNKRGRKKASTAKPIKVASVAPKIAKPKKAPKKSKTALKKEAVVKMWALDVEEHPESKNAVLAKQRRERKKREEIEMKQEIQRLNGKIELMQNKLDNSIDKDDAEGLVQRVVELGYMRVLQ